MVSIYLYFAIESFASQIFYEKIFLENMIFTSNLIVEAQCIEADSNPNHTKSINKLFYFNSEKQNWFWSLFNGIGINSANNRIQLTQKTGGI